MQRFSAQVFVHADGYEWTDFTACGSEEVDDDMLILLVPVRFSELQESWRRHGEDGLKDASYDPFVTEPALYRVFARLELTPKAILSFANKYGDMATAPELAEGRVTSLQTWKMSIKKMKKWVDEADNLLAAPRGRKHAAATNEKIAALVNRLLENVPVHLNASDRSGVIVLETLACNFLDAMKLQLALAVIERKAYRNCEQCNKPFEVSPQINRSDRVYCTDNCRVKAYQRRRKQAIAMRGKGETLREIAKKLGSDVPTVKKWVGEATKEE